MKYKVIQVIIFLSLSLILSCQLFAQQETSITNFNTSNGTLQNSIFSTMPDDMGYLWIATQNSLFRYDGVNFKKYLLNPSKNELDPSNVTYAMSFVPEGKKLLIRAKDGFVYTIKNGRPVLYSDAVKKLNYSYGLVGHFPSEKAYNQFNLLPEELRAKHGWYADTREVLPLNSTDFLVLGAGRSSLIYYKNYIKHAEIKLDVNVRVLLKSGEWNLYQGIDRNIYLFDSTSSSFKQLRFESEELKKENGNNTNPRYYWDAYNDESYCYYNNLFYQLTINAASLTIKLIPRFAISEEDHNWTSIYYDSNSNSYFLGTLTDGLFKIKLKEIETLHPKEDSKSGSRNRDEFIKYAVLKTSDSTVITASGMQFTVTANGIVSKKLGNIYSNRETIARLGDTAILCTVKDELIYYKAADGFQQEHFFNPNFKSSYTTLLYPEGDSVWVCDNRGVFSVTPDRIIAVYDKKYNNITLSELKLFYRINSTQAYISNATGLYKLRTAAPYNIEPVSEMSGKQIRHISAYKDMLILCAYKYGIYILKENRFYPVPIDDDKPQLKSSHTTHITNDGDIWITTDNGLFKSSVTSLIEAALIPGLKPLYLSYGLANGIANTEFNGAGTPPYAALPDGRLFYPSMGGIVTFNPKDLHNKISTTPIPIERIIIDNKIIDPVTSDSIFIPASYKYFAIDFSIPDFGGPENLVLEYNLDELGWKKISVTPNQRLLLLEDISFGYHQLQIRKRTGFGSKDFIYRTITLHKDKHIYEKVWFYLLIAVLIIGLLTLFIRLKTNSLNKRKQQLQKQVDEQTSELSKSLEIKKLLINVVSHDMSTPLRHISFIADILARGLEKDPERMTKSLYEIKATSERLLTNSDSIINWMKYNHNRVEINTAEENLHEMVSEVIEIYASIAKSKGIAIYNEVPMSEFVYVDQTIVSIIINNLISNAIKYSENREIKITATPSSDQENIVVKIADTGKGIRFEMLWVIRQLLKGNMMAIKTTTKLNTGLGYMIISELIRIHGLSLTVDSVVNEGTTVTLILPAGKNISEEDEVEPEL